MELDDEIDPLIKELESCMERVQQNYLPELSQLDEDSVVSHYDPEAQAKIYLSVAYTLALALYSHDKLQNEKHLHHPRVESSPKSVIPSGGSPSDARLLLQIERIKDSIQKLKEIRDSQKLWETPSSSVSLRRKVAVVASPENGFPLECDSPQDGTSSSPTLQKEHVVFPMHGTVEALDGETKAGESERTGQEEDNFMYKVAQKREK